MVMLKDISSTKIYDFLRKKEPLFGHWRVSHLLGSGATACVFEITRTYRNLNLKSALKVVPIIDGLTFIPKNGQSLGRAIGMFTQEITTLYELPAHPNLVGLQNYHIYRIKNNGKDAAIILIAMEILPDTLSTLLNENTLNIKYIIHLLGDCLNGLEYMHRVGMIHRDIKPDNIFIKDTGQACIGDFGIASPIIVNRKRKRLAGTPLFLPPEVYHQSSDQGYSVQADLYSLGMVAYKMFHGHLPFDDETRDARASFNRRMNGETIAISTHIPKMLREVLRQSLAYAPHERFSSAVEFRNALEQYSPITDNDHTSTGNCCLSRSTGHV